jgi:hypothetical protein
MIRTHGAPWVSNAGKQLMLSSTMTSGCTSERMDCSRGSQYRAPSMSDCHTGFMNDSSWSKLACGIRVRFR